MLRNKKVAVPSDTGKPKCKWCTAPAIKGEPYCSSICYVRHHGAMAHGYAPKPSEPRRPVPASGQYGCLGESAWRAIAAQFDGKTAHDVEQFIAGPIAVIAVIAVINHDAERLEELREAVAGIPWMEELIERERIDAQLAQIRLHDARERAAITQEPDVYPALAGMAKDVSRCKWCTEPAKSRTGYCSTYCHVRDALSRCKAVDPAVSWETNLDRVITLADERAEWKRRAQDAEQQVVELKALVTRFLLLLPTGQMLEQAEIDCSQDDVDELSALLDALRLERCPTE